MKRMYSFIIYKNGRFFIVFLNNEIYSIIINKRIFMRKVLILIFFILFMGPQEKKNEKSVVPPLLQLVFS